jgi:ubiquinone/menaquinone biosynthesis C-methylase UbiE
MTAQEFGNAESCLFCGAQRHGSLCEKCAIERNADGIFRAQGRADDVNYPEAGADLTSSIEETSFWFRHRNHVLELLLDRYPPAGALWDVGGGNGFQAMALERRGRPVVLVEPGFAGCRNAKKRGVNWVVQATLESLALPPGWVHGISLLDVLEHLRDPLAVLRESFRVLRPGGRIYVTVPAFTVLWSDEDIYAEHERRYHAPILANDLEKSGFAVEYITYYFQPLFIPILLLRALPYRLTGGKPQEMDLREHKPGGTRQKVIESLLARERSALSRGRRLSFGSSLLAVGRKS